MVTSTNQPTNQPTGWIKGNLPFSKVRKWKKRQRFAIYIVIVICPFSISHSNIEFLKPIVLKLGIRRLVVSNCTNEEGESWIRASLSNLLNYLALAGHQMNIKICLVQTGSDCNNPARIPYQSRKQKRYLNRFTKYHFIFLSSSGYWRHWII